MRTVYGARDRSVTETGPSAAALARASCAAGPWAERLDSHGIGCRTLERAS
ncbi:hypothetical protein [Asanoa hainanensis]|uniref:hypothetical protein n=1 Tax=Asanoa hainanensis TaxID=560556 RepID=UPI0015C665C7|nr:hypothetical protein [Asanoa hainanensis]